MRNVSNGWAIRFAIVSAAVSAMAAWQGIAPAAATQDTTDDNTPEVEDPCALPRALMEIGFNTEAKRAYMRLIRRNPSESCALKGLRSLAPEEAAGTPGVCDRAQSLVKAREVDAARELLTTEVKERGTDCAGRQLAKLNSFETSVRDWLTTTRFDAPTWLLTPLAVLVVVGLLGLVARFVGEVQRSSRHAIPFLPGPSLAFDTFRDPGDASSAASVRALSIAAFDREWREIPGAPPLDHVDTHQQLSSFADDLEGISERLKPAAGLVRLLERLYGRVQLTVSGQLHSDGGRGQGITLGLDNNHRLAGTDTLWLGRTNPGTDVHELAPPAGSWVLHQVAGFVAADRSSLQTSSAASFAWTRAGHQALAGRNPTWALQCYRLALAEDANHREALVAEALTFASLTTDYRAAVFRLDGLIRRLEQEDA